MADKDTTPIEQNGDPAFNSEQEYNSGNGAANQNDSSSTLAAGKSPIIPKISKEGISNAGSKAVVNAASKAVPGGEEAQAAVQKTQETVQNIQKASLAAQSAFTAVQSGWAAFMSLVVNPIFWIVVAVVLVIVIVLTTIIAGSHVIGKNENATGCIAVGSGRTESGVKAEASADATATSNSIAGWLMSTNFDFLGGKPMTLNQVAGIIGNWSQESSMNPAIIQGGSPGPGASNAEIIAISGGGRAVGLAQWDSGRRTQLAQFAEEKNSIWSDVNLQLEFFKKELDGAEGANLIAGGFNDQSKTAQELTLIFMEKFERAGIPHMENRYAGAEEFLKNFNGGYTPTTGGSCLTAKGNVNTSDAVELAISISFETSEESYVSPGDSYGEALAKQEYKDAKAKAQEVGGVDGLTNLYASCDRFVATIVKLTSDPDIPWGATDQQLVYFENSPKWQKYTKKSDAQPGDIWTTSNPGGPGGGHIVFYVGDYKGKDTIAHASYLDRVGALDYASYMDENLVDQGGRPYYGFRYIGG